MSRTAMHEELDTPLQFGSFELDLRARELISGSSVIRLQEQPFEVLRLLLERRGRVVTRDELRERLWPAGTFVDFEHSLNAAVKRLRASLGDDADSPRFIETVPRRGYRFIGDQEDAPGSGPARSEHRVRVAVLPFADLADEPGPDHFSDGLTDETISQLGRLCRGRVGIISSHSSMAFKGSTLRARDIGQALRADYLLEGSVRRDGDRVRITARLVDTSKETHLWVDAYEHHLTDLLSVQTEVATHIAQSLAMELAPGVQQKVGRSNNAAAYRAYLKGRYHRQRTADSGADQALASFSEAISHDPRFAAAHAGLASIHVLRALHYHEVPRRALERAHDAARRALELDSALAEGHLALGDVQRMLLWDAKAARASYTEAIALNPSFESARGSLARLLATLGRFAHAIREADLGRELDPQCLTMNTIAAWARYVAGDYDTAADLCRYTLEMDDCYRGARQLLGASLLSASRRNEALRVLEDGARAAPPDPVTLAWLAHARATTGEAAAAEDLLATLASFGGQAYVPHYHVALVHAGLGDLNAAFDALDQAAVDRDPWLGNVTVDPRLAGLRTDPRYAALAARLGLGDYSRRPVELT
jgi:TolB-like protein